MSDDRALVQAVLAGQPGAFEQLVRSHQRLVWHMVQRLVQHPDDARDLCQDTFLRVHRVLHQYRHESSLATWIGRIAYTVALRHLERQRVDLVETRDDDGLQQLLDRQAAGDDLGARWSDTQTQQRLLDAIEQLAPLPRTLLTLHHLNELPLAEIAQLTDLPVNTIKSHLFRARLRLRELLTDPTGDPP